MAIDIESMLFLTQYVPLINTVAVTIATIILVCLTAKYVRLTKLMLESMREARDPAINVDFELPGNDLRLVITNSGLSPAKNVRFAVTKDLSWIRRRTGRGGISDLPVIKYGIPHFSAGRKLKYYLGFPQWKVEKSGEQCLSLRVTFENESGKQMTQYIDIDMTQFEDVLFESFQDPELEVAKAIRESGRAEDFRQMSPLRIGLPSPKRACPTCGEFVSLKAKKCPHCMEWIEIPDQTRPPAGTNGEPSVPATDP
ncbi:MAG: hypothetical protein NTX17_05820 [Candidatus Eisenbacteria bacterium]|nr:hypothetical protein [Candidatus Eisenbacteria bacterium]